MGDISSFADFTAGASFALAPCSAGSTVFNGAGSLTRNLMLFDQAG